MPEQPGLFLTFEGPDGAGKTTQITLLAERLRAAGVAVVRTREPGGDPVGEGVRELLLERSAMTPEAEFLLFAASRAQNVAVVVRPALEQGAVVLCDRFTDSSLAYQGYARGLSQDFIRQANAFATRGLVPDRTFLFDLPSAEIGLARRGKGPTNRLDREGLVFHETVRAGYQSLAAADPDRFVVLNATRSIPELATDLWAHVAGLLDGRRDGRTRA